MPIRGLCPPLLRPPEPRQDDRSFSVVDPGTYVGLLPWEFTATLTEEVDSSAIISAEPTRISADPTRASYIAYPLPKCPTETWFTLDDSEGPPLPARAAALPPGGEGSAPGLAGRLQRPAP